MPYNFKNNSYLVVFAIIQLLVLAYYLVYLQENGYLPSPFLHDKSNTFMDLYNTSCWFSRDEYYSVWNSVYPPINFLFLQMINVLSGAGTCTNTPEIYRAENIWLIGPFFIMVLMLPLAIISACKKQNIIGEFDTMQKILLYVVIVLSPSVLFALERGNLIFLSVFAIVYLLSMDNEKYRAFLIAILINLKPYFLVLSLYYLAKRDFNTFVLVPIMSAIVFVVSGALLGDNYWLFFYNLLDFSGHEALFSKREVLSFPSSVSSFAYVFASIEPFPILSFLNSEDVSALIGLSKNLLLLIAIIIYIRNGAILNPQESFFFLMVIVTNIGVSVGGYSLLFYLPFLPYLIMTRRSSVQNSVILICVLMLNMSIFDLFYLVSQDIGYQFSFLGSKDVIVEWSITLGSVLRPLLNIILLMLVTFFMVQKKKFMNFSIESKLNKGLD